MVDRWGPSYRYGGRALRRLDATEVGCYGGWALRDRGWAITEAGAGGPAVTRPPFIAGTSRNLN